MLLPQENTFQEGRVRLQGWKLRPVWVASEATWVLFWFKSSGDASVAAEEVGGNKRLPCVYCQSCGVQLGSGGVSLQGRWPYLPNHVATIE